MSLGGYTLCPNYGKKWHKFKREYNLHQNSYFQLIDYIPEKWKFIIKKNNEVAANLITHDHHLIKGSRVITLDKLTSTEIYSILTIKEQNKPSSKSIWKICLITTILTGQQFICYHA